MNLHTAKKGSSVPLSDALLLAGLVLLVLDWGKTATGMGADPVDRSLKQAWCSAKRLVATLVVPFSSTDMDLVLSVARVLTSLG